MSRAPGDDIPDQSGRKVIVTGANTGIGYETAQGFELQFGVNHLVHFALTGHLLPPMTSTKGSRVVVVSSTAAQRGVMNFDDLNFEQRGYQPWPAYGQSKLANQLFTLELQRRFRAAGSHDAGDAARLWEIGEELTGVRFGLPA